MTTFDVHPFDPTAASQADLLGYFQLSKAAFARDLPDAPPLEYDAFIGRTLVPHPGLGEQRLWIARATGLIVGAAVIALPKSPNEHIALVDLRVLPAQRGLGIGSLLLAAVLPELRVEGRTLVSALGVTAGGDGDRWARSRGFREVRRFAYMRLTVVDVPEETWRVPAPEGYRLVEWSGAAPEEWVASFARAFNSAQRDETQGDTAMRLPDWTVERIRAEEAEAAEANVEQLVAVAVDLASGEIVSYTVMHLLASQPNQGHQQSTAVLAGYRGKGLGRFVKAAMMRRLVADRPQVARISTGVVPDNIHMIRINTEVGYVITRTMLELEAPLHDLESSFGPEPTGVA